MFSKIAHQYSNLVGQIGTLIEISGFRNDYLAKKIGMQSENFSVKKQRGNWEIAEVEKLVAVLERSEEVEDFLLAQLIESRASNQLVSIDEIKKEFA